VGGPALFGLVIPLPVRTKALRSQVLVSSEAGVAYVAVSRIPSARGGWESRVET
jgi:hypothetical protein